MMDCLAPSTRTRGFNSRPSRALRSAERLLRSWWLDVDARKPADRLQILQSSRGARRIVCSRIDFKILLISFKALQQPRCKLISELFATTPLDTYFDIDGPEVVANARLTAESVCREGWIRSGSAHLNLFLRDSFVNGPYFALKERRENPLVRPQEKRVSVERGTTAPPLNTCCSSQEAM